LEIAAKQAAQDLIKLEQMFLSKALAQLSMASDTYSQDLESSRDRFLKIGISRQRPSRFFFIFMGSDVGPSLAHPCIQKDKGYGGSQ
jgi:hypothetical protein